MKNEESGRPIRVRLSAEERELFVSTARSVDVPHNMLMRHLVRYVLRDEVSWLDLLKEFKELKEISVNTIMSTEETKKITLCTQLTPELYTAFARLAEEWGSTTNIILRRLMLLYSMGKIERHAILG